MQLVLIGMNHKTAPLEIRERLQLSSGDVERALPELMSLPEIREAICLSTCNRVEVISRVTDGEPAVAGLKSFIYGQGNLDIADMERCLYVYRDLEAVRHLFRVTSSLDSMVMGEPQILGQLKEAYRQAVDNRATTVLLNRLLHHASRVAKRVRTETGIAGNAVSVSYAAVELAKKIFGNLQGKTVLLIGAGEMSELAARHLINHGVGKFLIANRTYARALEMAETFQGQAIEFQDLAARLGEADIVISSTGATGYVITREMVAQALHGRKKNRLLFLIDIAVPRDIDPAAGEIDNAFLYNIDDLQEVVDDNLKSRRQEAERAETIIEEEVEKCRAWMNSLLVVPTIVSLRQKLEGIIKGELDKSAPWMRTLDAEARKNVEIMAAAIVNKIIHDPITSLKDESQENGLTASLVIVRRLFKLDQE